MFILPSLDSLVPAKWPYPVRGAVERFVRTLGSWGIGAIIAAIPTAVLHLPIEYQLLATGLLSPAIAAIDKYLREKGYEETTDPIPTGPAAPTSDPNVNLGPASDPTPTDGTVDGPFPQN